MKNSSDVIKKIVLTEKGTRLSEEQNQYLFRVTKDANKVEIKRAVEELFNVRVMAVNTMRRKGKKKRQRTAQLRNNGFVETRCCDLACKEDSINLI